MIIVLPWPDKDLMPNRKNGRHWGSTHHAKLKAQKYGFVAALETKRKPLQGLVPITITFYAPDKRHRDLDNLLASIKPHLDGVAQGLGIDDKQFRPITLDYRYDENKQGYVTIGVNSGNS